MSAILMKDILEEARKLGIDELGIKEKSARTWFKREAEKVRYINEKEIAETWLKPKQMRSKYRVVPGTMVFFQYDAKWKADLPYWDKFPLIFPIKLYDDGFLGINMHYLPHDYRAKLMDALMTLAFSNKYDEDYRLRISYEILNETSKFKAFRPCVKRYLGNNVRSQFNVIDWKEWNIALFLPLEKFRSNQQFASPQKVWSDSVQSINANGKTGKK